MLKRRIIPIQLLINNRLVKTVNFDQYRDVGDPVASSKVYCAQDADELIFLNIDRSFRNIDPLKIFIEKVSEVCFMPLTLGGGIRNLENVESLIKNGADKVVLNSVCYTNPDLISLSADKFGSQAIVVSIDVKRESSGSIYSLFSDCGRKKEEISLDKHLETVIRKGAGEILINSIDKDGTMTGYDIELIKKVKSLSNIPVIGCGGAGTYAHMEKAFNETHVEALACGSLFNFGDNNPIRAKAFLSNYGLQFKVI